MTRDYVDLCEHGNRGPDDCERCRSEVVDRDDLAGVRAAFDALGSIIEIAKYMETHLPPTTETKRVALRAELIGVLTDKKIPSPAKFVDAWYADASSVGTTRGKGKAVSFDDPEPSDDKQDGAQLLDEISSWIGRYVTMSNTARDAVALYIAYTHAFDDFDVCPNLFITSPTWRCGKTTLLKLCKTLVPRPLMSGNLSAASIFRVIEDHQPVLLIDEADSFVAQGEDFRGLINSGHTRESAFVIRQAGPDKEESRQFSTWGPKMIAAIGRLWNTVEDRSVIIGLTRRSRGVRVERARSRVIKPEGRALHARLARWVADHGYALSTYDIELPHLNERSEDNWLPLFAVASAAGGDWPARATAASRALDAEEHTVSIGEELILAAKPLFDAQADPTFLPSKDLIDGLATIEGGPWENLWTKDLVELAKATDDAVRQKIYARFGNRVGRDLRPFGIPKTTVRRVGETTTRGYERAWFEELWKAYGPVGKDTPTNPSEPVTPVTPVTPPAAAVTGATGVTGADGVSDALIPHDQATLNRRYETSADS